MSGCRKKTRIFQMVAFLICLMFLAPGLLFADEKEDPAAVAKRKAAWSPPEPKIKHGYAARYSRMVSSGSKGAVCT